MMNWKIEVVPIPVTDIDRAKAFYVDQVGFHPDIDQSPDENTRFVQLTPPGSACSIVIGKGIAQGRPGAVDGIMIVVPDIQQAHDHLAGRGVDVSDVEVLQWGSFVYFGDPDGNRWTVQQLPPRS